MSVKESPEERVLVPADLQLAKVIFALEKIYEDNTKRFSELSTKMMEWQKNLDSRLSGGKQESAVEIMQSLNTFCRESAEVAHTLLISIEALIELEAENHL